MEITKITNDDFVIDSNYKRHYIKLNIIKNMNITQEQKVKAYDEALERARKELQACSSTDCDAAKQIFRFFPELKESEFIKEEILALIRYTKDHKIGYEPRIHQDKMIAYLENQGNKYVNIDIESMVNSYKQRLKSQGSTENNPLFNMYLTAFRQGIENVLEELNLKKFESEQKPKCRPIWSGEDDYNVQCCIAKAKRDIAKGYLGRNKELIEWLKSLKQRI